MNSQGKPITKEQAELFEMMVRANPDQIYPRPATPEELAALFGGPSAQEKPVKLNRKDLKRKKRRKMAKDSRRRNRK